MFNQLRLLLDTMDKKNRIGLLVTIVWLIVWAPICLGDSRKLISMPYRHYELDLVVLLSSYLILGILPVVVAWGIVWVRSAK